VAQIVESDSPQPGFLKTFMKVTMSKWIFTRYFRGDIPPNYPQAALNAKDSQRTSLRLSS
jgi:hypothetical protein